MSDAATTAPGAHAVYPGSFDPPTSGHLDVVERAAVLFPLLTVAVVANPQKRDPFFTLEERELMLRECVRARPNVRVANFRGLLADFVREAGARTIVKGLRVVSDFENEMAFAHMNRALSGVDTLFLMSDARFSFISSSLIKEVYLQGGDVSSYVPSTVLDFMRDKRFVVGGR